MDLDLARPEEPHDPDPAGAGAKRMGGLRVQLGLVPAGVDILDRQRRHALNPTGAIGHVADGHIGRGLSFGELLALARGGTRA